MTFSSDEIVQQVQHDFQNLRAMRLNGQWDAS
jgi:hypothetical protein